MWKIEQLLGVNLATTPVLARLFETLGDEGTDAASTYPSSASNTRTTNTATTTPRPSVRGEGRVAALSSPSSSPVGPAPPTPSPDSTLTITTFPHPLALLGVARYHIYRLLQYRMKYHDDSGARDWLARTKKPEKPKETSESSRSALSKFFRH